MPDAAGEPVVLHHGERVEASAPGVGHEAIERGPAILRAADAVVDVLLGDLEAAGCCILPQRVELGLDVLVSGGHAG